MNSRDYIDRLRDLTATGSDYAVAKLLEISEDAVNNYRKGKRQFDEFAAMRTAELLNLSPVQVIADVNAARETDERRKKYWRDLSKKLAGSTAAAVLITAATLGDCKDSLPETASPSEGEPFNRCGIITHGEEYKLYAELVRRARNNLRRLIAMLPNVSGCIVRAKTDKRPTGRLTHC